MIRLATLALALLAGPAFAADTHDVSGTTVRLAPTDHPGAVAEVQMRNLSYNGAMDNGTFTLDLGGVSVSVTFAWNAAGSEDRITVETGPDHYAWPESIDVPENAEGVLYIYPLAGVGS